MHHALIGLGANLGNREQTLGRAVARLGESVGKVTACSAWHETAPVGGQGEQQPFLNGALTLATALSPSELLDVLNAIETELGRRPAARWAARVVDLDLLLYDVLVLDTPRLKLPHPRMAYRRFVLEPAAEIAAELVHPPTGWTLGRLLRHLHDAPPYLAIAGLPATGKTRLARQLAEQGRGRLLLDPESAGSDIELVSRRAVLLNRDAWPTDGWTISDFWFEQSLAWAAVQTDDALRAAIEAAWRERRPSVMPPKLLAVLEPRSTEISANSTELGTADRLRLAIHDLAGLPDQGPVIRLSSEKLDEASVELLAAMQAMR